MTPYHQKLPALSLALLTLNIAQAETIVAESGDINIIYSGKFSATRIDRDDECYALALTGNTSQNVHTGEICIYGNKDPERARYLGFVEYSSLPSEEKKYSNYHAKYVYTTPFSMYQVKHQNTIVGHAYIATNTDCDIYGDQPVYRATGTCNVGLVELTGGGLLYLSIEIRDDVQKKIIGTNADLQYIINHLIKGRSSQPHQ